jgi:peptidase M48-like protein
MLYRRCAARGLLPPCLVLSAVCLAEPAPPSADLAPAAERALRYLLLPEPRGWEERLRSLRPAAAGTQARARSLALVRSQDLVEPSPVGRAKLAALPPILRYFDREAVTEVRVLRLDLAWAGALDGAAVLVSDRALDLLGPDELQAVVAHELAHEYFAAEYQRARQERRWELVKEIELRCDGVAVLALARLGQAPDALARAIQRLTAYNERRGVRDSPDLAPPPDQRTRFQRALLAQLDASATAP